MTTDTERADWELFTDALTLMLWGKLTERDGAYLAAGVRFGADRTENARRVLHGLKVSKVKVNTEGRELLDRAEVRARELLGV